MNNTNKLNPLGWKASLIIFIVVAAMLYITHYILVPNYTEFTGKPYLIGYLWGWVTTVAMVFIASLAAYKWEGHPTTWQAFSARFRLSHMPGRDWLWTLTVLIVTAGAYFGLSFTAKWLAAIPVFAPHRLFPTELRPDNLKQIVEGQFMGMPLEGQWWIVAVYFIGWVLNILGEEFFYRGWMLPRQEAAFGKYAWLINGTMFCFQHFMQPWNFLAIWPGALFMAFVVQYRRNTWIGIIQHGLMNFSVLILIVRGVIG
jgi:membrane protease YdiL (CAAX protease family)